MVVGIRQIATDLPQVGHQVNVVDVIQAVSKLQGDNLSLSGPLQARQIARVALLVTFSRQAIGFGDKFDIVSGRPAESGLQLGGGHRGVLENVVQQRRG